MVAQSCGFLSQSTQMPRARMPNSAVRALLGKDGGLEGCRAPALLAGQRPCSMVPARDLHDVGFDEPIGLGRVRNAVAAPPLVHLDAVKLPQVAIERQLADG